MANITKTRLILAAILCLGTIAMAAPPDLTNGGVPGDSITTNLGPTGMRGWVYHVSHKSDESRQILVTAVTAGSPAAGVLAANDVILGADGNGLDPANFSYDARVALADAINNAEAKNPAKLKLLRWRSGTTSIVEITLRTMGTYSATAPYNCPKSTKILDEGLAYIMGTNTLGETITQEPVGRYSFGALTLLAVNDPLDPDNAARMARAETAVLSMIPSAATMTQMMSDERDDGGQITWSRGHTLIVLSEYYLVTGDTRVLPAIEAFAVNFAKNQSMFGTVGHIFAEKNPDGSHNGPMGGGYGTVNSAGMPCFYGLLLARQCGLTNPQTLALMDGAIERSSRFFAYYAGKGAIPYGEHEPYATAHESNGKSGLAALCFRLQPNREYAGKFNSMMATAATSEREIGHTGPFFNYLWSPLGAAAGGEAAAASYFHRARWHFDLSRRWDGGFDYDNLYGEGSISGASYSDFRMSTAALLTYALPLRKLHLTGRGHDPARNLTNAEVTAAEQADGYVGNLRGTSDLVNDLGSWSPMVQRRAAEQLVTRTIDTALLSQLTTMATDPNGGSRIGATYTLGKNSNSTTANSRAMTLAGLLTDPENHVRFMAAEAMRYLPQTAKMTQLNAVLSAAASTGAPLFPLNEEDPLHFAHGRLAMLLFYSGTVYGPKGMISGTGINGVDRNLLYPAIRAVAAHPVGQPRSTLGQTYLNLTATDVNALADTLLDSIQFRAPADKMFSAGVRDGGLQTLEKFKIADGVPVAIEYMVEDGRSSSYTTALAELKDYAGGCKTVTPDPDIIGFCKALLGGPNAAAAQAVINAINADTNPAPLSPFKTIQSTTANTPSVTLPANQNGLHVIATDLAKGNLIYTWRKVHGVGNVTFTPNGTATAKDTAIQFDNTPGKYLFEVTVSDSRGFTEVYGTVPVTLYNSSGGLPPNSPPTANPQSVTAPTASAKPITLTATDPEGYALIYSITTQPQQGTLTGVPPNVTYISKGGYTGADSFTFQVMDTEGQVSSAKCDITVNTAGVQLLAYEPFDYPVGILTGQNGGLGFSSAWLAPGSLNDQGNVWDENTNVTYPNENTLNWNGVLNNGFLKLPAIGARYAGATASGSSGLVISRTLASNAGTLAGDDGVLWMSAVFHLPNRSYGSGINLGLGNGYMNDRGRAFGSTGTDFIGASGWIPVTTWNYKLNTVIVNDTWSSTANDAWTASPNALPAASLDLIVVLKFTFGPVTDTVEGFVFDENVTTDLSESVFNAGKIVTTSSIDESTLNVLSTCQSRFDNAMDEIRIGNSFAAVVGVDGTSPDLTPPTLVNIADDRGGEPVLQGQPVYYSFTFSEAMASATIGASDFNNAGTSSVSIQSVNQSLPNVVTVQVIPTTPGTLQLRIPQGAVLTDLVALPLNTTTAITDDTVITVNPALVDAPFLIGLTLAQAQSALSGAGLATGTVAYQYSDSVPPNQILAQNPSGGTSVPLGTSVALTVSLDPAMAYLPNVIGQTQAAAQSAITAAGLVVGTVSSVHHTSIPAGQVISQTPSSGTIVALGSAVDLVVSLGDIIKPSPDPMTFATPPTATSSVAITMTATTASDSNGVQYRFLETSGNPGGTSSAWQDSPNYTDAGLSPVTTYIYTVQARDKSANQNTNTASAPASTTTEAASGTGGADIYEPFDMAAGPLVGQPGGYGLSGNWIRQAASDANQMVVAAPGMTYGTLTTAGNSVENFTTASSRSNRILTGASLSSVGLLADGATLWFSILVEPVVSTNAVSGFALCNGNITTNNTAGVDGVGINVQNGSDLQYCVWKAGTTSSTTDYVRTVAQNNLHSIGGTNAGFRPHLVVGKIIWGTGGGNDTFELFMPDAALVQGSRKGFMQTINVDQSTFDRIVIYNSGGGIKFDEIRFGASYDAVIGKVSSGPGPLDRFAISAIPSPQTVGQAVTGVTLIAQDAANQTVTSFNGTVTFGGTGGFTGTSAAFTNGVLSNASMTPATAGSNLTLTVTDSVSGKTGSTTITTIQTPYEAWSSGSAIGDDANGDGVNNGLAFLLGATGPSAPVPASTVTQSSGNLILTFTARNDANRGTAVLSVQHSRDLGVSDPWVAVPVTDAGTPASGVTFIVTPGSPNNTVQATISSSEGGGSGKLFSRLRATP